MIVSSVLEKAEYFSFTVDNFLIKPKSIFEIALTIFGIFFADKFRHDITNSFDSIVFVFMENNTNL